ncbi:hypothetical protein [Sphingopyxis sp. KK2]|uniref:hypothetical protein n=1 Tax=Sphingopyxis sp. KK2 TaxID=1855727 RepID=UPI001C4DFE6D|nr:hypothetical protein [Sphingopyxis sp. KK2]
MVEAIAMITSLLTLPRLRPGFAVAAGPARVWAGVADARVFLDASAIAFTMRRISAPCGRSGCP